MADRKISDLTALTAPAAGDYLPIVDISEVSAANKNKRITIEELLRGAPDGTAAAPSIGFESDPNTGIYRPGADALGLVTGGTDRLRITSAGLVGINTASPGATLHIHGGGGKIRFGTNLSFYSEISHDTSVNANIVYNNRDNAGHQFMQNDTTELARIDSSGRLLVGASSARSNFFGSQSAAFQVEGNLGVGSVGQIISHVYGESAALGGPYFVLGKHRSGSIGGTTLVASNDQLGAISFTGADGTNFIEGARIQAFVDGTPGANDMPGRLVFSTTADGASTPTERMRIDNAGRFLVNTESIAFSGTNSWFAVYGGAAPTTSFAAQSSGGTVAQFNRQTNDGQLITFFQDGTEEGNISVSGTTVSYNGAHLSRWSQLPGGAERTEILRGSVLSNIDEMCEWGDEDNEQLNRMKVSDVEGDKNVSGVFQAWDDDDDTYTNDFYCAMTGDFIIRIAQGATVERGDLLMSAGDGTAKPQDDDIIRSKTIAKVTSTNVSCTYEDGSYCVPCVLMAC